MTSSEGGGLHAYAALLRRPYVARSRSSSGYSLEAVTTVILSNHHCLHQTQGTTPRRTSVTLDLLI